MSFELRLALKYFRFRQKSAVRFTSVAAVVGIAVGVAGLIIAQSLAKGFQDEMRDKILANTAHISIFRVDGAEISNWKEIKKTLENAESVSEIAPTAFENSFLIGETASNYAALRVISNFKFQPSDSDKITIALGRQLAEKANLKIGDEAEIITLENEIEPKHTPVLVSDIFETGLFDYDSTWIYISPEDFARLHNRRIFAPTSLSVSVKNIYESNETTQKIKSALGENFRVVDWQEANRPLFAALSLERKVSLAVISLIIFIAALNITTTLALLVNERRLDIAVLRTCGAETKNLVKIFLFEGLFLGFIGISCGVILGLLCCLAGNRLKIVSISAEVYSLNYIPFHPEFSSIALIILIALAICLAACVYPAFSAGKIKPSENLRLQ